MKNNKAFYRSALATAIVMALSAPAFAADNAVSTTPVTLDKDKTTLDQDVVINGDKKITAVTIETSDSDKDLNVTFGGHDITAASTVNQDFVEGVKVSGNKNVVINATDSTITAQGEGTYVRTAMVIDSTGDVVVNGGNFVAKNEKGSATGISLEGAQGNNVTLNGTTINAQGNKSSSNASTAIFAQKGSVLNGFNGDATDNITLAGSNIINGRIETILIAQENKGTHTVNLNIKDGSVDALAVKDSTVNITKATVNTGTFASQNGTLIVDASSENTLDISGKASGDLRVYSAGSLDLINEQTAFISTGKDSTLKATGTTEGGLYQYDLTQGADGNFYFVKNTHKASNASSVIQAMAAAPANVANLQADTLSARQDAVRLSENDKGGVWIQYFGGKQKHTTAGNASYDLDVNGVMLGGDTRFMTEDGSWLAGVAMSSAKGDMTTMQSKGDTEGYSFHAYLSRQYNNGIFIDTAAQFGHYSNTADVRLMNGGGTIKADFNTNGFGAMVKGGYTWKDGNGLFIQPYAKLSALTLEGVDYQLNGVNVHSDSYNSVLGEAGTRVGYDFAVGNASVKPYLNLAALNEFSDGNKVRLGDESVNASIDGAAFRVGAGVQADITKNMGAYASLDYTKGDDIENPLQGVVGINVTW
ncbi:autotransporter outer membrane beta-barrel domain-containing protein [Escherichia coli]|uniref:Puative autotransporter/virulence factor n=3 Tax=Escherichia coli TaxID=562 RepID=A0AB38EQI5_ECOLX|nr:autotransporter outer membrane beta-barrel domain-containing protein [Escherichia coli]KPP08109.1 autotransporter [Escherichia coli]KYR29155.1 autotransporter outer membrane beta-barrel domain-containing protein [Escherichia coli]MCW3390813.1 autotransporter outer membrane beta-barrel domain-containing protein [Escherichia coli]MCW3410669.1 autotransporter outer membrane beta-barrel domain-containing protein [Escherichia coli]MCW7142916.1 autotransporter outer membrane beta-barrel domain-co